MPFQTNRRDRQGGQIIVLFALSLVVIIAMGGLLFTGAQSLVMRRQLQNAGDAAALAAANLLIAQDGCSATAGGVTPRAPIVAAAKLAVTTNIPGYDTNLVQVTCPPPDTDHPDGYGNNAVQVDLSGTAPSFFGAINLNPRTSSTAFNGQDISADYSVALLDPSRCESYLINGGITVTYEGSMFVSSACTQATGNGSVKAQNASFRMTMLSPAVLRLYGEASPGTRSKITPAPEENFRPLLADPLGGLVKPCHAGPDSTACLGSTSTLPARNTNKTGAGAQCSGPNADPCILQPGTYSGGILAANGSGASTMLLRPGVYYIEGGGLELKSGAGRIISIPSATGTCGGVTCSDAQVRTRYKVSLSSDQISTNWEADCPSPISSSPSGSTCGVMIYNAKADNKSTWTTTGQADQVKNGAQGALLLRGYNPIYDALGNGTVFESYKNLVLWQARTPAPPQPVISMRGGACLVLSGTVYAPGGDVDWGGGSCGTGGGGDDVTTLQFVVNNLTLSGTSDTYFAYQRNAFATPFAYGLIK